MDFSLTSLISLVGDTIRAPREGARRILALGLPMSARWSALALMAVLSALLTHFSFGLMSADHKAEMALVMASPVRTAVLQGLLLLIMVHSVHWFGRLRGGKGTFADALMLVVWLQFILLCLQVTQIIAQVLVPPVGDILGIVGLVLFFWLLTHFVAELHGFTSLRMVFVSIVLTMLGVGIVIGLVLLNLMGMPV